MHPLLFLEALRARIGLFMLALGATLAAALVFTTVIPRTYKATASLVVDTRQEQSLSNALEALSAPRERAAYLQTQVDIIRSPTVARRVVQRLELDQRPELREEYAESAARGVPIGDWLAARLLENLDVETTQSSVVHLTYMGATPEDTAATANAFAEAYMATMLELRVEPTRQAATWFDEQLTTLRGDLEQAQARMTRFQQEHGIVSADERIDDQYARFEDLSQQLNRAQQQAIEDRVGAAAARRAAADATADELPEILASDYIRQLEADLLAGEAALGALATQYGANHPEYQHRQAENAALRERRRTEALRLLAAIEMRARQSEARVQEIERVLAEQRVEVLDLKSNRDALGVLLRNVDSAQSAYDTAMQRYVVSQVESRASQTSVAMLSRAVTPSRPYRPNLILNVGLALVVGTMLGVALVMLAEMSDRRIRSVIDLTASTDIPLLGELDGWVPSKRPLLPPPGPAAAIPSPTT